MPRRKKQRKLAAKLRRQRLTMQEISLTPLIDTALTLLIIFMVTTPMIHHGIKVELPKGKAQEQQQAQQELVVSINKDEKLFFNGQDIEEAKLMDEIKRQVGIKQDQTVFVMADQAIHYGKVIELVDRIKYLGGVKYVALATKSLA